MKEAEGEVVITLTWAHIAAAAVLVVVAVAAWGFVAPLLGPSVRLSTSRREYRPGDEVVLEGWVMEGFLTSYALAPVAVEVRGPAGVVWVDQVTTDESGHFTSAFTLRGNSASGDYEAYASSEVAMGSTKFRVSP